jgi:predicted DNA-binding transcriptional regulator YafY
LPSSSGAVLQAEVEHGRGGRVRLLAVQPMRRDPVRQHLFAIDLEHDVLLHRELERVGHRRFAEDAGGRAGAGDPGQPAGAGAWDDLELRRHAYLDVPGWHRGIESLPRLSELADAVWHGRRIKVRYERWGQRKVDRVLDPLGLILKAGNWYLAARCDGNDRTYRVSRIEELEDLGESFERPADFDLERYWQEWSEQFERRMYPRVALVRLSELARILLPFYLGSVGARALREAIEGGAEPDEDGWLEMELPTEPGEPAVGELLRFGGNLEVLEPPELRERLAEEIRKMGACYG